MSMPKSLRRLVIDEMEVDPGNVVIVEGLVGLAQTVQIVPTGRQSLSLNLSVPASLSVFVNMAAIVFRPLGQGYSRPPSL